MGDWALLLIIIAGYYLDAKKRNFMLMYLVLVSVTLLLDVLKIATTTGEQKTPGEAFGSFIFFLIFCLKFGIVGAIYMYQSRRTATQPPSPSRTCPTAIATMSRSPS